VGGRIIDLSHAAAQELGYDRAGIAHVRVRYVGPAPLAGPEAGVRYAKASAPAAYAASARPTLPPQQAQVAERGPYEVAPLPPPEPIVVAGLASAPGATSRSAGAATTLAGSAEAGAAFRIQAGAFSDQDNARRAAARLASAGNATVEPFEKGGTTLYRVTLPGPADEAEAYALRDKVAGIGFADARVLRP
jgi:rare lipoprotein A